ncbi:MAG TPA: 1,4-alpha-glucan branching protein GlgB [Chlamydiales bacterium]|nr:1,4-alpha-glucan branching protein GlgB [Chlamydiales bacterium]
MVGFSELRLHDPHSLLGLHDTPEGQKIRLWRPGGENIYLEVKGKIVEAQRVNEQGLFEYAPPQPIGPLDYRIYHQNGLLACDPYAFLPTIGEMDTFLFNKGCHYQLYGMLGANLKTVNGIAGTRFAVWAPNARSVSLVGDFNHWDGRLCPMRSMGISGVWELFVPGLGEGEKYKFEIHTREGYLRVKSDPMAFYSELRPLTASIVYNVDKYQWKDQEWMGARSQKSLNCPMNVYEVHLGSWRKYGAAEFPNYREVAVDLARYCKEMGFTHVELMPIMEHPFDESWGYQVTGFYAVTSRYGTPTDFQFFVDHMHANGIGVLLDWVPAHFPTDDYSLNRFDGTALYEHEDPRKGIHPHWQTAIFNYGRAEVVNFLLTSALFWFDKMHIDGLRVDAVASMVYLDYGRKEGEWIPNPDGSNFNIEAIEFLKHLNAISHERYPGILLIAEESSSYTGVTHPNGLGFDLKWNMGWMNDTLRYFSKDPIHRKHHQGELTFSLLYAYSERFMLVLSHDEVVHGKGSLITKMPGPDWQRFANVRLLYSYLMCHPGKKLLFMGGEIGQWNEWDCKAELDWHLLDYPLHQGLSKMVRELNHFYHAQRSLWEHDFEWYGYEWIDFSDAERSVISYLRKGNNTYLVCVHNFTPEYFPEYWVQLHNLKSIREVFNTDEEKYGGSGKLNPQISASNEGFKISLSPLATLIFEVDFA